MATYKRQVLLNVLTDLYPSTPIACGTTYASIILYYTEEPLVPELTIQEKYPQYVLQYNLTLLRRARNQRLVPTDIYMLPDFPHANDQIKQAWVTYRQALRNITETNPTPMVDDDANLIGVVWPTAPDAANVVDPNVVDPSANVVDPNVVDPSANVVDL